MIKIKFFENIGPGYLWRVRLLPTLQINGGKVHYAPFNLFLHIFWRSDHDRALHDHPWPSLSVKLWGFCYEHYWLDDVYEGVDCSREVTRYVPWLRPIYRSAEWRHRMSLPCGGPVVTLFFVGFKQRSWGFWPEGKFIPWREYLNVGGDAHVD